MHKSGGWVWGVSLSAVVAFVVATPMQAQNVWRLYQFHESERFRYEVRQVRNGTESTGHYALSVEPAGEGRVRLNIDAKLGEMTCQTGVTIESSQAVPTRMMVSCPMIMPVALALYAQTWNMFLGQSWEVGNHWSMGSAGQQISFRIERECTYAGQTGVLAVMRQNDEVRMETCVSQEHAIPLAVTMNMSDDGDRIELTLVEYEGS